MEEYKFKKLEILKKKTTEIVLKFQIEGNRKNKKYFKNGRIVCIFTAPRNYSFFSGRQKN